jgi:hypothetical protein
MRQFWDTRYIANLCDAPQNQEVKIVGMQITLFTNLDS